MRSIRSAGLCLALVSPSAVAQSTQLVSVDSSGVQGNDYSQSAVISADGRYVAFHSTATNLVAGDTNGTSDIFERDLLTGVTIRVSVDSAGAQANSGSVFPVISGDGRYVAFPSAASNLVAIDGNGTQDIFVHDRVTGATTRMSVDSSGNQSNAISSGPAISADGRFVAFYSYANNLIGSDTNGASDVFVHDRQTGQTTRVSVDSAGAQGNAHSDTPSLSADGRYVAFESNASNLVAGDTNGVYDCFVKDRQTGQVVRVSLDSAGNQGNALSAVPALSADARFVVFTSNASNLVAGDTNATADVFFRVLATGQTIRVSVDSAGVQGNGPSGPTSFASAISSDGRRVAFGSAATNLVAGDSNGVTDVFVRDLASGTTTIASVDNLGGQGDGASFYPSISGDGTRLVFETQATNLDTGDTNGTDDVLLREFDASGAVSFCSGDGTHPTPCPCANFGSTWHGCENSAGSGGALLAATGTISPDQVLLTASGELPSALSIFLQGSLDILPGVGFGDGVRCVGGSLKRLYLKSASGGVVSAPGVGDNSISAQSALLGDTIAPGTRRSYQVYYRDPNPAFCPFPTGNTWNVSNAVRVAW